MIVKDMLIDEVVKKYPETIPVFERFGFHCIGCVAALFENVEEGAKVHGVNVDALITNLNGVITQR